MNLNLLKSFVKIAELGSLTKAAESLNQPKSRVSRNLAGLEKALGVDLVRRTTRQTSLTASGEEFFQKIAPLLGQIENEILSLADSKDIVQGKLRITAPEDMGETIVSQVLKKYSIKYPLVEVEILITNEYLDLVKENIDIAFRAGKLKDSNLIQRKLTDVDLVFVASKNYLQTFGRPKSLEDFQFHKVMLFSPLVKELKRNKDFKTILLKPYISSDSFFFLRNLALANKGITILPDFFAKKFIQSGEMERVVEDFSARSSTVQLVYPPTKNLPSRTREFIRLTTKYLQ